MDHLTDGFVPEYMAPRLMLNGAAHAETLVESGLWICGEIGGERGWIFHDWEDTNPSKEAIQEDRRKARERMANIRNGSGDVRANKSRSSKVVHDSHTHTHTNNKDMTSADAQADRFPEFWAIYPRKISKGAAIKAWNGATKKATPDAIISGLKARASTIAAADPKFTPHPATWLNGERWADDLDPEDSDDPTGVWSLPDVEEIKRRRGF